MPDAPTDAPPETETPDTPLGDAGQKALDAMKVKLKAATAEAKEAAALRTELDQLKAQSQTEAEKAVDAARKEAADAARAEVTPELTNLRLQVAVLQSVGPRFADPADALRFIDAADVLDANGEVDPRLLAKAADDLLEQKPYLGSDQQQSRTFPDLGQGVRTDPSTALNGDPLLRDLKSKVGAR